MAIIDASKQTKGAEMKIEKLQTLTVKISNVAKLDLITVTFDDEGNGKGRLTVNCAETSLSCRWPAMGCSLVDFVDSCGEDYLISSMSGVSEYVDSKDTENFVKILQAEVIRLRKSKDIEQNEARRLFAEADDFSFDFNLNPAHSIFGDAWHLQIPAIKNPEYIYQHRIIETVKLAVKQMKKNKAEI